MAHRRGLLEQPNFNELQERLLMQIMIEEKVDKFDSEEANFEKQLLIHRPEVWQKIQEEREEAEEMGLDEIVWKSPESIDEYEEIEKILRIQDEQMSKQYQLEEGQFEPPTNPLLSNIDFDELGD